jgi:hypothetical protein
VTRPTCEGCGAPIEPAHLECPFCKTATPFGVKEREREERERLSRQSEELHEAHEREAQARAAAQKQLETLGRQSFAWSLGGVVLCCMPLASVVALVLAWRAKTVAKENGLPYPGQATAARIIAFLTLASSASAVAFGGVSAWQKSQKIAALVKATEAHAADETLDRDVACKLVEAHLLKDGFATSSDDIGHFTCDGPLEQHGATAVMRDLSFTDGPTPHTADATLRRGAKWIVEKVTDVSARPSAPAQPSAEPAASESAKAAEKKEPRAAEKEPGKGAPAMHAPPRHDAGAAKGR